MAHMVCLLPTVPTFAHYTVVAERVGLEPTSHISMGNGLAISSLTISVSFHIRENCAHSLLSSSPFSLELLVDYFCRKVN